jgi:hypothetical protein
MMIRRILAALAAPLPMILIIQPWIIEVIGKGEIGRTWNLIGAISLHQEPIRPLATLILIILTTLIGLSATYANSMAAYVVALACSTASASLMYIINPNVRITAIRECYYPYPGIEQSILLHVPLIVLLLTCAIPLFYKHFDTGWNNYYQ